jgi:hypothetical protein
VVDVSEGIDCLVMNFNELDVAEMKKLSTL